MNARAGLSLLAFAQHNCKKLLGFQSRRHNKCISFQRYESSIVKAGHDIRSCEARVLFLGNDNFSLESLKAVTEVVYSKECLTVVTTTEDNVVGKFAKKNDLPRITWNEFNIAKKDSKFDVGVVASFGHLIPKRVIDQCHLGILNVHGSILPKYRGAAPISRAIINGDEETGVTIMQISPHKFDVGPILAVQYVKIHPHIRAPELTRAMAHVGAHLLGNVLENVQEAISSAKPQDGSIVSLAPKLNPEMGLINWETHTAAQIYNLFRGLSGFHKLYTFYRGTKVDLNEFGLVIDSDTETADLCNEKQSDNVKQSTPVVGIAEVDYLSYYAYIPVKYVSYKTLKARENFQPGQLFFYKNLLLIKCSQNSWVSVTLVKVGAKWQSAKDFQNGYLSKIKSPHIFSMEQKDLNAGLSAVNQVA